MLVGREEETGAVAQLISAAQEGVSGVLVLADEAGTGKTALMHAPSRLPTGCRSYGPLG